MIVNCGISDRCQKCVSNVTIGAGACYSLFFSLQKLQVVSKFRMALSKTFIKRHNFKRLSLSIVLPICLHVCFALLTAGVVVGSVGGCRPDTATKPNNESSRSERGFIHFIFLSLDSALDRGRVPIWSPQ